jgi:23S rRNA pseudouridine1911/1915/1917 synthase
MSGMPALERRYHDLSRPVRAFRFVVDSTEEGGRLDTLLRAHYPWKSRAHYQRMLERGQVRLNGRATRASARVRKGDEVVVDLPVDPAQPERESDEGLVVLYEDAHLLAVDKPSGLAAHPVGRIRHGTLINKLHARYRSGDPAKDVVPRLGHRLDQDTSGVVLVVKNRRVDALVTEAFARREVEKTYLAVVEGRPAPEGAVDAPLGPDPEGDTAVKQAVVPGGAPSRTSWRVRTAFSRHALLELTPHTGRTHQLRVHLAHAGHPIACDHLYGDVRPLLASMADPSLGPGDAEVLLERLALHHHRLRLEHPVTGAALVIESPLPADLSHAIARLADLAAGPRPCR